MATISQQHPLADGSAVHISRNGNHQYWIGDNGPRMRSVTSMVRHIEGDSFGVGLNWGIKMIREHDGDLDAPKRMNSASIATGNALHEAVDAYIQHGTIDEEDSLFVSWFSAIGETTEWIASERLLYHTALLYGGTLDGVSMNADGEVSIHDLKTVDPGSWNRYADSLRRNKDTAQLAAYADALTSMGSIWAPTRGYITYVLRDGGGAAVLEADLERGTELFRASREMFLLTEGRG
jgi:hypothetical protein